MSYLQSWAVFISVAEERSFSAAAKKLSLSQPTVSFHIDSLEKELDCPLFRRTRRGVELTAYGMALYESTCGIKQVLERSERKLLAMRRGASGKVTIGAGTIPGEYILPSILPSFLKEHPDVSISLISADSQSIFQLWQEGELPICVIGFLPSGATNACKIWEDEIIPVVSPKMIMKETPLPIMEFCSYPLVLRHASSASMEVVRQSLKNIGISMEDCNIVLHVSGNEALKTAVKFGAGIGFISKRAVARELAEGSLLQVAVEGLLIKRYFYALMNGEMKMPVTLALWQHIIAHQE
jgi:DNA-binding transcriptional LysR family regulator